MAKTPEVLVVDQNPQVRFEVKRLLKQSQFALAGEAGFGTDAVSLAMETRPDVIICGMDDPATRSIQTIYALVNALPETAVIVYASTPTLDAARQAMLAGARDFVGAPATPRELEEAVAGALESEERRRMRLSGQMLSGGQGTIITVFGPKGGVGKTTIATNLALALAQETDLSVAIVDADTGFGDVAGMLDLKPHRTIADLAKRSDTLSREEVSGYLFPHSSGLLVLAAPAEPFGWRSISADQFRSVVETLARLHDVVIIDTGGDLGDIGLMTLELATLVLWVTTPEFSSIKDSLQGIEALQSISFPIDRIKITINSVSPENGVRPRTVEEVLQRAVFWQIPYDRRLRHESDMGEPHVLSSPTSPAAQSLIELAGTLGGTRGTERPSRSGLAALFARVRQ